MFPQNITAMHFKYNKISVPPIPLVRPSLIYIYIATLASRHVYPKTAQLVWSRLLLIDASSSVACLSRFANAAITNTAYFILYSQCAFTPNHVMPHTPLVITVRAHRDRPDLTPQPSPSCSHLDHTIIIYNLIQFNSITPVPFASKTRP